MYNFFIRIFKSSFLKVAGKVGLLTFIGNIVGIILLPIISRYFNNEEFGLFSLFFNLLNILIPFMTLGLNDAFISVKDDDELKFLLGTSVICTALTTPILCFIIFCLVYFDFFGYGNLPIWTLFFFFVELILISLSMILQSWSLRNQEYIRVGISNFYLGIVKPVNQILYGINGIGFLGLLLADMIARLVSLFIFLKKFRHDLYRSIAKAKPSFFAVIKKYRIFLSRIPSTFIFNLGTALPALLITNEFGLGEAGNFTFMMSLLIIPSAFVQKVLGEIFIGFFFQKLSENPKEAISFFKLFLSALIVTAFILSLFLYLFATHSFIFFFGNQWKSSASMLILYIPYFIGDFSIAPFGTILNITNKPHYKLFFDVLRLGGFILSSIFVSCFVGSVFNLILLFSLTGLFSYLVYLFMIIKSLSFYKIR